MYYSRINLTASPFQTQSPDLSTFYKQNNNKNVRKRATAFEMGTLLMSFYFSNFRQFLVVKQIFEIICYSLDRGLETRIIDIFFNLAKT